jgi:hypothetical protein
MVVPRPASGSTHESNTNIDNNTISTTTVTPPPTVTSSLAAAMSADNTDDMRASSALIDSLVTLPFLLSNLQPALGEKLGSSFGLRAAEMSLHDKLREMESTGEIGRRKCEYWMFSPEDARKVEGMIREKYGL